MDLLVLLVAVVTVGGAAAVAAGRVRGGLDPATSSRPHHPLPAGALRRDDVDALQFSLGLRGYRMDEVDEALARLADELADRDARIAELQADRLPGEPADPAGERS